MHPILNPSLLLPAVLAWSAQACVLAAGGALTALTIANPRIRLAMWQGLLLILLLLPAIEPWKTPPRLPAAVTLSAVAGPASTSEVSVHWRAEYWLWILALGAVFRLGLVVAGFLRLRRYRQQAQPLPEPPLRFASDIAQWYASDAVRGPVTYGWRQPVILLPSKTLELPAELREVIECHELIHVHRRDWLWVLAETAVRSLLWFHPAVWFLLNRIQLTREQTVDREVVQLFRNRDRYLDALVAVASHQLPSSFAPAFVRKRQLAERVRALIKEVPMSRARIAAGFLAAGSILPLAVVGAMWFFPFVGAAQTTQTGGTVYRPGDGVTNPIPISRPKPQYSEQATKAHWGGTVVLSIVVDEKGVPRNVKVVKPLGLGLDEKAIEAAQQWRFRPGLKNGVPVPVRAQIEMIFRPDE